MSPAPFVRSSLNDTSSRKRTSLLLPLVSLLSCVVLLAAGCSSPQTPECVEYVACQRALDAMMGSDSEAVTSRYDEGGVCWDDALQSTACTAGCVAALEAVKDADFPPPEECGGEPVPATLTQTVGADGAVLDVEGLRLDIPAGALPADTEITIEPSGAAPSGIAPSTVTESFKFSPDGLTFETPVTVRFQVPASALTESLSVYGRALATTRATTSTRPTSIARSFRPTSITSRSPSSARLPAPRVKARARAKAKARVKARARARAKAKAKAKAKARRRRGEVDAGVVDGGGRPL